MSLTLVTGAAGHVGNSIVRALRAHGHAVRAMVRPSSNREALAGLEVEIFEGDMLDEPTVRRAVDGCEVVHHTAAAFTMWARDPEREIIQPTLTASRNLLQACRAAGTRRIVYVSSAGTLGTTATPVRLDESTPYPAVTLPYMIGKVRAEEHALRFATDTGLDVVFVLPGLILGPSFWKLTPSVVQVRDFLDGRLPFYFEGGFSVVDARDVAAGCLAAAERGRPVTRYVLGGENCTVKEFLDATAKLTGLSAPAIRLPIAVLGALGSVLELLTRVVSFEPPLTRAMVDEFGGRYGYLDSTRARTELGYQPRPLRATLYDTVEWCLARGFVGAKRRDAVRLPPRRSPALS
jgi:dihydroflavonol-4-reductase